MHVLDPKELVFLDLGLFHDQQAILNRNHTKPTSGNSYFHFASCHHSTWKKNIPKGQFKRLRRNCSKVDDYITQGKLMQRKFEEKGCPIDLIQEAFISHMDLSSKSKTVVDKHVESTVRFVSTYNNKNRSISKIIRKHYKILQLDQRLAPKLPSIPQITFRKRTYGEKPSSSK